MMYSFLAIALLCSAGVSEATLLDLSPRMVGSPLVKKQASPTCLANGVVQSASALTGQEAGTTGIKAGQAESDVDDANFINFCAGEVLTNGKQITTGSCNGIPMGQIPATENMISAMITNPLTAQTIAADTTFNISVQVTNLDAGSFTNPTTTYYTAPQELNAAGNIIGHCHVSVQEIGSLTSTTPPDPNKFAFFKGIDDAGNGKGLLQATVAGGLPAGTYRVCTLIGARNHQPVIMPVAQRGPQDDCNKFIVGNGQNNGQASAAPAKTATNAADEGATTVVTSAAPTATVPTKIGVNGTALGRGGKGRTGRFRFGGGGRQF
ncbi:hypothetical protein BGZ60DRAFT_534523 [Tricladium varicosporioides]|nr:hypothetical protein BGZ60DRAFT_534523 [Hymenoscyphus varicosporioides]